MKKLILLNTKALFSVMLLCLLSCVSTGCGSSSLDGAKEVPEVNGTVLLPTGRPLKGGKILLRPCGGVRTQENCRQILSTDGTFLFGQTIKNRKLSPTDYKVFISLNTDPSIEGLKGLVPEKYQDVSEDDFETDLFVNLAEQADGIRFENDKRINP